MLSGIRVRLVSLIAVGVLALGGCSAPFAGGSTRPATSASAEPVPSASAAPVPSASAKQIAKIQIDGKGLTLLASDGTQIERILYSSDPTASVAILASHIGSTPQPQSRESSECERAHTIVKWGDGLSLIWVTDPAERYSPYVWARSDAPTIGNDISIETPQGFSVGGSITELAAVTPGSLVQDWEGSTQVWFDLDADGEGVYANATPRSGPVRMLGAPVSVHQDC